MPGDRINGEFFGDFIFAGQEPPERGDVGDCCAIFKFINRGLGANADENSGGYWAGGITFSSSRYFPPQPGNGAGFSKGYFSDVLVNDLGCCHKKLLPLLDTGKIGIENNDLGLFVGIELFGGGLGHVVAPFWQTMIRVVSQELAGENKVNILF